MLYIKRDIEPLLQSASRGFPVIALMGPRQSGKTTLARHAFPDYLYINLEDIHARESVMNDPKDFFLRNPRGVIFDEVQNYPELFSQLQVHVDEMQEMGAFIVTGSQNLLLAERITQSLAGRAAYLTVLPLSISEVTRAGKGVSRDKSILTGGYPALCTREVSNSLFYSSYITTYVERDVRQIRNITNLPLFQKFLILMAGRVGQLFNATSIANDVGVSPNTVHDWVSILETSYIIFQLQPFFKNVGKRVMKSPKIYFIDTGLLCSLLNIGNVDELSHHSLKGGIFENFVVAEHKKYIENTGVTAKLYFYRDSTGNEIDLIVDNGPTMIPIEIKSSSTFTRSFLKGLEYWRKHVDTSAHGVVVYGGEDTLSSQHDDVCGWNNLDKIFKRVL